MKKALQRIKRQYLTYSRSDRNGIVLFAGILLIAIVVNYLADCLPPNKGTDFSEIKRLVAEWEADQRQQSDVGSTLTLFKFDPNKITTIKLDSLNIPDQIKRNIISYRRAGGEFKNAEALRKIYGMTDSIFYAIEDFIVIPGLNVKRSSPEADVLKELTPEYFNPNTVTVEKLETIGFNTFQVNNMMAYRTNGGAFRTAEDLLKIYGIDSTLFLKIKPYLLFDSVVETVTPSPEITLRIELNSADSSQLVRLPGIGPAYANRIIRYRELLGGYYSTTQLLEVYNLPPETYAKIQDFVYTDTLQIKKLRINFLDYAELLRHPYLSKTQVTQILEMRDKRGAFRNLSELSSVQGFGDETFNRIMPYLTCF
ncbi:helix-hairpin-helix domain-containing protein [Maribellus sp. YY47]|uniref:helix-hairpin-helix domain-containing protein n=1 Tax=Maribellus sp. YY47 TaxID=2929486 RepID=UPI0020012806|nr:helix-hairpin-helix domain-containing protein [Maribellus sp. YY47]MCK3686229.1 helix-hairpin-helix domain-containing protein [Maribellus sp. YY47]